MPHIVRKPRVEVRAALPVRQLYQCILEELARLNDQLADEFAGQAAYATDRAQLITLAKQYVDLIELPSA